MSEEDDTCPLCIEEIDITDRYFKPCPCEYRICRFCWINLIEQYEPQCPACRRPYSVSEAQYQPIPPEELERYRLEKKKRTREKKEQTLKDQSLKAQNLKQTRSPVSTRVVQKNVIYITGLPPGLSNPDTLRSREYLSQFGKVIRVNTSARGSPYTPLHPHSSNTGIYVFFTRKEDAVKALEQLDGCYWGSNVVRVTYATTKYCTSFLRKQQCRALNCPYLHRPGEDVDTVLKEEFGDSQSQDKARKPLSFYFPIIDEKDFSIQRASAGGRSFPQKTITSQQPYATSAGFTHQHQLAINKKQSIPTELVQNKKQTQSEINISSDKKPLPSSNCVVQVPQNVQRQKNKGIKVIKSSRQRPQNSLLTEDSIHKLTHQLRSMKANNSKSLHTRSLEDSLDSSSYHPHSPVQPSTKSQPNQIYHPKTQSYAKHFKDQGNKINKTDLPPRIFQQIPNNSYNAAGINWLTSFQPEAGNMIRIPDITSYNALVSATNRKLNDQDKDSNSDILQNNINDEGRIIDNNCETNENIDENAHQAEDLDSTKLRTEHPQNFFNTQSDTNEVKEFIPTTSGKDAYTEAELEEIQHTSIRSEEGSGGWPSDYFSEEEDRLGDSQPYGSGSSDLYMGNSNLEALNYTMHPVYTGVLDPFSDDILSMLSSVVILQGVTDQINDNTAYYPTSIDNQYKSRYSGASRKDGFSVPQGQQVNMGDNSRPVAGMRIPGYQCASTGATNSINIPDTRGIQTRHPHFFGNNSHRPTDIHHDYQTLPISKDLLFKKTRDGYDGNIHGLQYPASTVPPMNVGAEYENETQQPLRQTDYHKHQSSSNYQDLYFVNPWTQQAPQHNAAMHQLNDQCSQNSRRQISSKKQAYGGDSMLERDPEQSFHQAPRNNLLNHQQANRTCQDLFHAPPHFPNQDIELTNSSQPPQKQYAPTDIQYQGDGLFAKTGINFRDSQMLHMSHLATGRYCNTQIQELSRQHPLAFEERNPPTQRGDTSKTFLKMKGNSINIPHVLFQNSPEAQLYDGVGRGPIRYEGQDGRITTCIPEWYGGPQRIPTGSFLKSTHPSNDIPN